MPLGKAPVKWTLEEEKHILEEIESKKSIAEIAEIHDRSNNAIVMHICNIAKRMIDNKGKTIQEAQHLLKLVSINEIENYIKKEEEKKTKNEEEKKIKQINKKEKQSIKKIETIESVKEEINELNNKYNELNDKYNKLNDKLNEIYNK